MIWDKDAVKNLRQSLKLTQAEFADLLGCRQQTISEWELGMYAPANAYGKLLTQLKVRSPSVESPLKKALDLREGAEFFQKSSPAAFENDYDRPFDPAID